MKKYKLNDKYYLRKVKIDDANDLFTFASDDDVTEFLTWNSHKDVNETRDAIKNFYLTKENIGLPNSFVIVDDENEKVIGVIDFLMDDINSLPKIGYFLNKSYWKKGIMTLALGKILEIGFEEFKFEKIAIMHRVNNYGSKKVIEKNNFKYMQTIHNHFLKLKDVSVDLCYYETDKGEYYGNK